MSNPVSRGTMLPAAIAEEMIQLVRGKSSLARLSKAEPIPFNGIDYFTFDFDNEISIVGENEAKVAGGVTVAPVRVRPYKFEYGARFSDEFIYGTEEYKLDVLRRFAEGMAAKAARGLDIGGFHGVNPRSGNASTVVGNNNFDTAVTQTATATANADTDVETAVALVQGNDLEVSGMAMAPAFRSALAALTKQDGSKLYPELGWGKTPGTINGLPVDSNSTVSFGSSSDLAIIGDFEEYFRWGYAKDISIEIIRSRGLSLYMTELVSFWNL